MNGAHCLECRENGPDLIVDVSPMPPIGTESQLDFVCGECGVRWIWRVTLGPDGWRYELEDRDGLPMVRK